MSASGALQAAIVARLEAASVSATIYDGTPASKVYPRIEFGDSAVLEDNAECVTAREETLRLNVYARDNSQMAPCKALVDEVWAALDEVVLDLADPYAAASECRVRVIRVARQQDGITVEGVLLVSAMVETVA